MAKSIAATQDDVRRNNVARILLHLHTRGQATRSDLVALTGLNRSTVAANVTDLVQIGLVEESSGTTNTVGRPSIQVAPLASGAVVLAFELKVESLIGTLIGLGGHVLARLEHPHLRAGFDVNTATEQIVQMSIELIRSAPEGAAWVGTGISVPGSVDTKKGIVRLAPNLGWSDVQFGDIVTERLSQVFGRPPATTVGNDSDFGAIAEQLRGSATGTANVIYVSGEVGIGGGVVLAGRPMTGGWGYAGEVGHMVVDPKGEECRCGSQGCWETVIGHDAIVRSTGHDPAKISLPDLIRLADSGDPAVLAGLREAGWWLGLGIANLVNIFNPNVVVLGGHLGVLQRQVSDIVDQRMRQALPASRESVEIRVAGLGGNSTLIGAAEAAFAPLLADPLGTMEISSVLLAS